MASVFGRDARLEWEAAPQGVRFRVVDPGLIGGGKTLPIQQWAMLKGQKALSGASMLLAWLDAGNDDWVEGTDTILVPHDLIAELGTLEAGRLGLPSTSPFFIDISHSDTLDGAKFSFRTVWRDLSGQEVVGLKHVGAIATYGTQKFRISNPLHGVLRRVEKFNADPPTTKDARLAAWGQIRAELLGQVGAPIKVGPYLKSINVLSAGAISIRARITGDGFQFDPILCGKSLRPSQDRGDELLEVEPSATDHGRLLPEHIEQRFAEEILPRDGARSRYVIDDGLFVVVDEIVRRALERVEKVNEADTATRNSFALNPRSFFADLAEEFAVDVGEFIVASSMFSERVIGLGEWRRRTLSWLQKEGADWLPDEEPHAVPIDDSGRSLIVVADDVVPLCRAIQDAIRQGIPTIEWQGTELPATPTLLSEVAKITGAVRPTDGDASTDLKTEKGRRRARVGLLLQENEEQLNFQLAARSLTEALQGVDVHSGIKTSLKPHQIDAIRWLQDCYIRGSRGALLADDMGLGKTLTVLAFLNWLRQGIESSLKAQGRASGPARPSMPFLIVAPTSLLGNWEAEEQKHLENGLGRLVKAYGPHLKDLRLAKGKDVEVGSQRLDQAHLANADWILTTYETLSDYHLSFSTVPFVAVVFDEAQKVKTPAIPMTDAAASVWSKFAIAMTGTPVENRLADLWTIMDVVWPGQLAESLKDFVNTYEKGANEARLEELYLRLTKPRGDFPPLMMRRLKEDELKGLPKRSERTVRTIMAAMQARAFQQVVEGGRGSDGRDIMRVLQHMRGISLHPSPQDQTNEEAFVERSARLKAALEILDEVHAKGEKALVFIESRAMQPYLASLLQRRYRMSHRPMTINGSTLPAHRTKVVDSFQSGSGFDVLLLGPKSAGTGLTLTAANHAIHLSRWWNPAVEDQCSDRIYRMGQEKPITIYYLLAIHPEYGVKSFDEKLHELLMEKRRMSRQLLQPVVLTPGDIRNLMGDAFFRRSDGVVASCVVADEYLTQFDEMDWHSFEEWVLTRLKDRGYQASRTPKTGDGGADGVFVKFGGDDRPGLVQCKHTTIPGLVQDDKAVLDLVRARDRYGLKNPRLVAITNAAQFSRLAQSTAGIEGVELIARADLARLHELF